MALSAINQRRWSNFRKNRTAFVSLWLFLFAFFITLGAEIIANDKPLYVRVNGEHLFPVVQTITTGHVLQELPVELPEALERQLLNSPVDWQDESLLAHLKNTDKNALIVMPIIPWHHSSIDKRAENPAPPSSQHWLGTDDNGRDVFARLVYGFRISVLFGLLLTVMSGIIGITVGAVQGYFGGWVDLVGQRFIEIWAGLPMLFILIIVASVVPPGFFILLGIMLLFSWTSFVGPVRAEFLRARKFEFVKAARVLGVSEFQIMLKHVLPNALVATITFLPFVLSGAVTSLTGLDFLGFGLPPGSPSLGELLLQGKNNLGAWWLGLTTFITLGGMLALLIFIGQGVRDALDPRKT